MKNDYIKFLRKFLIDFLANFSTHFNDKTISFFNKFTQGYFILGNSDDKEWIEFESRFCLNMYTNFPLDLCKKLFGNSECKLILSALGVKGKEKMAMNIIHEMINKYLAEKRVSEIKFEFENSHVIETLERFSTLIIVELSFIILDIIGF